MFIGGTIDLQTRRIPDNQTNYASNLNHFTIQPQFGFFLNDKFTIGGNIGYFTTKQSNATTLRSKTNGIILGLFFRRYFKISDNFYLSLDGNPYYRNTTFENSTSSKTKTNSFGFKLSPVFSFFPSKNWGIEAGFGSVSFDHTNHELERSVNIFELNYGTIKFGLTYYFRRDAN